MIDKREAVDLEVPANQDQQAKLNDSSQEIEMEFEGGSMKGGRQSEKNSKKKTSKMSQRSQGPARQPSDDNNQMYEDSEESRQRDDQDLQYPKQVKTKVVKNKKRAQNDYSQAPEIICCGICFRPGSRKKRNTQRQLQNEREEEPPTQERIKYLWSLARAKDRQLRQASRNKKKMEQICRSNVIDEQAEDQDLENQVVQSGTKLPWYLVDGHGTFCSIWNFCITLLIIYTLTVAPFILVFKDSYRFPNGEENEPDETLVQIEYFIDIVYCLEIILNFLKRTNGYKLLNEIALHYLKTTFLFDVVATVTGLYFGQSVDHYGWKLFRWVHIQRLTEPLDYVMKFLLRSYSKKRQNDLSNFTSLILMVIYTNHICACLWLYLGKQMDCRDTEKNAQYIQSQIDKGSTCTSSWTFQDDGYFDQKPYHTQYIFAFYWIFEVITTVGYGDYVGKTSEEYVFSIALQFIGLIFFSFLMGSINSIFNTSDNFEDLIDEKLDSLDMWIKKIEKSNKPFHIQPYLYNDIKNYINQAFLYDYNLVIEEFPFYQQMTPQMQTQLISQTAQFKRFERNFNHFFEECERGFINELIISLYCRIYQPGKTVISYKSSVKEMYFIKTGQVEVFNNENDELRKEEPILYLPTFSYFGDYQILYNLKSNLVFKTMEPEMEDSNQNPEFNSIIFMCIDKTLLLDLCDLFPQTAENIKRRSKERRLRFMQQRNTNSHKWKQKLDELKKKQNNSASGKYSAGPNQTADQHDGQPSLDQFFSDEEPENFESQKEDMKLFLNKLNKRIDVLVDAWKKAENMMSKMGDYKVLMEQAQKRKEAEQEAKKKEKEQKGKNGENEVDDRNKKGEAAETSNQPITDFLREEIRKSRK